MTHWAMHKLDQETFFKVKFEFLPKMGNLLFNYVTILNVPQSLTHSLLIVKFFPLTGRQKIRLIRIICFLWSG